jgi:ASC-1-like (ASCH) protein
MVHELKCEEEFFNEIFLGHKTFEVRKNDRDFYIGDTLILNEYNPKLDQYSGRKLARNVTYVLHGGKFGIKKNFVVMSIQ